MSQLYRPGSVAYVSKSGGMSNELNNIIARNSDGVYEGVAIGGDRYPGTRFIDHLLRYQDNPAVSVRCLEMPWAAEPGALIRRPKAWIFLRATWDLKL